MFKGRNKDEKEGHLVNRVAINKGVCTKWCTIKGHKAVRGSHDPQLRILSFDRRVEGLRYNLPHK